MQLIKTQVKSISIVLFVTSLSGLMLSGCKPNLSRILPSPIQNKNNSDPSISISIDSPSFKESHQAIHPIGWKKVFSGDCGENGQPIRIKVLGDSVTAMTSCESGRWKATVVFESSQAGSYQLMVTHQNQENQINTATAQLFRPYSGCETIQVRSRTANEGFGGGLGEASDPYLICTPDQLNQVRSLSETTDLHFVLANDIDLADPDTNGDLEVNANDNNYQSGSGWAPITSFGGVLDGNGFEIRNLFIRSNSGQKALFSSLGNSSVIRRLLLLDFDIQAPVAAALANQSQAAIEEVFLSGRIECRADCSGLTNFQVNGSIKRIVTKAHILSTQIENSTASAGIVGWLQDSIISDSHVLSEASIKSKGERIGGIVAGIISQEAIILHSSNAASIEAEEGTVSSRVGGLVGSVESNTPDSRIFILNSSNKGRIDGDSFVGGLLGLVQVSHIHIHNSYNSGNVSSIYPDTSDNATGGFSGSIQATHLEIRNSFSIGNVQGISNGSNGLILGLIQGNSSSSGHVNIQTEELWTSLDTVCDNSISDPGIQPCSSQSSLNIRQANTKSEFLHPTQLPLSRWDRTLSNANGRNDIWHFEGDQLPIQWFLKDLRGITTPMRLSGKGTQARPFLIRSAEDLKLIATNPRYQASHQVFRLENDIDFQGDTIEPISLQYKSFQGSFDGNQKTLSNFKIENGVNQLGIRRGSIGLFHQLRRSQVSDLIIESATLVSTSAGGTLAGSVHSKTLIKNVTISRSSFDSTDVASGVSGSISHSKLTQIKVLDTNITGLSDFFGISDALEESRLLQARVQGIHYDTQRWEGSQFYGLATLIDHSLVEQVQVEINLEGRVQYASGFARSFFNSTIRDSLISGSFNLTAGISSHEITGAFTRVFGAISGHNLRPYIIQRVYSSLDISLEAPGFSSMRRSSPFIGFLRGSDPSNSIQDSFSTGSLIIEGGGATQNELFVGDYMDVSGGLDTFSNNTFSADAICTFELQGQSPQNCSRTNTLLVASSMPPGTYENNTTSSQFVNWDFQNVWQTNSTGNLLPRLRDW